MIIDAHQHFWKVARGDYPWMTPDLTALYRDFMPDDMAPLLAAGDVGWTVLVQAAPTLAETEFMLQIADTTPFVLGVVGWVDFESPDAPAEIARLAAHPKLVGIRPMIQDLADDDWMLMPALTPAFEALTAHDLTFDALVFPRHLANLQTLLARHPDMRCVIDHGAKPDIAGGAFDNWAADMAALAQNTAAYCKLSGLMTEAGDAPTASNIAPYAAHLLASFGAERLIWGSDWPVLTLAGSYGGWLDMAQSFVPDTADQAAIFGGNATRAYGLTEAPSC